MPKYGYHEIADLGSRCSSGCWIFKCAGLYRVQPLNKIKSFSQMNRATPTLGWVDLTKR